MRPFSRFVESRDIASNALKRFATHYDDFKDFEKSFLVDLNHGYYWHLTDDPNFSISGTKGPRDMSSMSDGRTKEPGALMVTSHLEHWDDHYNGETATRPYAALLDLSGLDPRNIRQVDRGFGNEFYLTPEQAAKARLVELIPVERAREEDRRLHLTLPANRQELMDIWSTARKDRSPREFPPIPMTSIPE